MSRIHSFLAVATLLTAVAQGPSAASEAPAAGHWEGMIAVPGSPVTLAIDLVPDAHGWEGWIDIPLQGLSRFPLSEIRADGREMTFAMKGIPGSPAFRGTVSEDGATFSGEFSQSGGNFPFSLEHKGEAIAAVKERSSTVDAATAARLSGSWAGAIIVRGQLVKLTITFAADASGTLSGTLDIPAQGAAGLALSRVNYDGGDVLFSLDFAGVTFEGQLLESSNTIHGMWNQGEDSFPLELLKSEQPARAP